VAGYSMRHFVQVLVGMAELQNGEGPPTALGSNSREAKTSVGEPSRFWVVVTLLLLTRQHRTAQDPDVKS
jgi:hypothetical protein